MEKVKIIGGHGMGDCLMAFQCASIVRSFGNPVEVIISSRQEIYETLHHLFGKSFDMIGVPEMYASDNNLLKNSSLFDYLSNGVKETYYVIPDLLFNNEHSFDYFKYHTSPQMIRNIRLLNGSIAKDKSIYVGLISTTPGYSYSDTTNLVRILANNLPDYSIHLPVINSWANKEISGFDNLNDMPDNVLVHKNETLSQSMDTLRKCCYFVGTDNGPSHIAYHMGIPRLLLDPQFNLTPWIARWREDFLESVPIYSEVSSVAETVILNIKFPQTTLLPRMNVMLSRKIDLAAEMFMKKY